MSVYDKGLITVLCCDLLIALVAIPLWLRMVPRNVVYGYRTRATLADDEVWYAANAHFGRGAFFATVSGAVGVAALYVFGMLAPARFLTATIVLLAGPLLVATLLTARFVSRLSEEHRR